MTQISLKTPHDDLAEALERIQDGNPIVVEVQGSPVGAIISMTDLRRLEEYLEELDDLEAYRQAKKEFEESGRKTVPFEDVCREMGL